MGGGGGGGGDTETTYRFAPYLESHHKSYLNDVSNYVSELMNDSPFASQEIVDIDAGFFGVGYTLASFPSLYDIYGKFMAGLDVEALYDQMYNETVDGPVINDLVAAESQRLSDELTEQSYPQMETGKRDLNAVMSSTFVVARGMLESSRVKTVSKFSAELRYRVLPLVNDRWKAHLEWNSSVVTVYRTILELFTKARIDMTTFNYEMKAKAVLWPFTLLEYERAALGALTGARDVSTQGVQGGASGTQKALGGAMAGASAGYMVSGGNPYGAVIGGALGLAAGLMS